MKYKDKHPTKTVEEVEQYFYRLGFKLVCKKSNDATLYPSYTLVNPDTGMIVNGKGSNKSFAKASAYGELCERLFNWCYLRFAQLRPASLGIKIPNCTSLAPELLQKELDTFLLLEANGLQTTSTNMTFSDYVMAYDSEAYCFEFFSDKHERLCLPIELCDRLLGTNGMAAGNSYHEAFIQAFSEIAERKAIMDFNAGKVIPKSVPVKDITNKDVSILNKIERIKTLLPVDVHVLTFEETYNYPIALVLLINRIEKKMRFKFGAHCTIVYAVERCLTELVQGADICDNDKWISLVDMLDNTQGEIMKIFQDGSGCLSRKATEICLQKNVYYYSKWYPSTNLNAYNKIRELGIPIYEILHTRSPLAVIQLYIPGWSVISWPTENELADTTQKIKLSKELIREISDHFMSCETIRNLKNTYGLQSNLNDMIVCACPIERQFFRRITVADLYLAVAVQEKNYPYVCEYFYAKHKDDPENDYYAYAFIKSCYLQDGVEIPEEVAEYFSSLCISKVNDDFLDGFSRLLLLNYCERCPRHNQENCISSNKIRLFNYMVRTQNEGNDF